MIVVWVLLDTGNQIIHQALGRNSHPPPGGIAIGKIITPLVIGFLGDLALPQRIGRCLPFVQHPVQLSRLLAVPQIHTQANITLGFLHIQAVPVFQGEKRVHEADIGINIRHRYGMGRYAEDLRHLCCQIGLRISVLGFILCHAYIGGIGRGLETCGGCGEMGRCEKLGAITEHNADALKRLKTGI